MNHADTRTTCLACRRGWDHCHQPWVVHVDGGECTAGAGCARPDEAHQDVTACIDVDPACAACA